MSRFVDGSRLFDFDDEQWQVVKYDEPGGEYRTLLTKFPPTKAVDFVGVHKRGDEASVWLKKTASFSTALSGSAV